jgi:hypothetical protein
MAVVLQPVYAMSLHVTLLPNHVRQAASASDRQLQIWPGDLNVTPFLSNKTL